MRTRLAALLLAALAAPLTALAQGGSLGSNPGGSLGGTGARVSPNRPEAAPRPLAGLLAESVEDPATLIRLADAALGARRLREASDMLERAEARLLTRSELASEADRPAVGGAIGELAAARDAIGRRDAAGAQALLGAALRRIEAGEAPSVAALPAPQTGGGAVSAAPAWGGGPPAQIGIAAQALPPLAAPAAGAALPGIAPQNMPVGGSASPAVPIGADGEVPKGPPSPGSIPPASTKPPPL